MWNPKNSANECIYKTETNSQTIENKPIVTKEKGVGGINQGFAINRYRGTLLLTSVIQGPTVQDRELYSTSYNNNLQ